MDYATQWARPFVGEADERKQRVERRLGASPFLAEPLRGLGYDSTDCCAFDLLMDVRDKNMLMGPREAQALSDAFGIDDPAFFIRYYDAWRTHPSTKDESNIVKLK